MTRLWDKGDALDDRILSFTVGNDHRLDERLVAYDVRASVAHAHMLASCGHLTSEEVSRVTSAFASIAAAHQSGEWDIALEEEDCHTALEHRLADRLGELGGKIHLGRSRNDQVLAALRLYLLDVVKRLAGEAENVAAQLDEMAKAEHDTPLPGYTHLQRAMPSTVGAWARGFASEIRDDATALSATRRRVSKNPLGSAAGYGTPGLNLSRTSTTEMLGFDTTHEPVTSVQLSRGKAEAEVLFQLSLLLQDLGRLAADVVLFASSEFGFVKLSGSTTTGSSIMPQKRNPDVFELVRGHSAQSAADLTAVLTVTTGLTSGYHRDLQLLKEPLFRGIDRASAVLGAMPAALAGVAFDADRCAAAIDESMLATERAYRAVTQEGLAFRDAYRREGEAYRGTI